MAKSHEVLAVDKIRAKARRKGVEVSRDHRATRERPAVPDPAMTDRVYSDEESAFVRAIADYQARTGRRFPTYSEVLSVLKSLGYHRP